jgi:hypothetical protein
MAADSRIKAIERATGRTWDEWLQFMEGIGAKHLKHPAIATRVLEELDGKIESPGWWAQGVTVAYEQHMGQRVPGQRMDGTFETSVSRATPLGMTDLMDHWSRFAAGDEAVLALVAEEGRVRGTEKRLNWRTKAHDGCGIQVTSEPKKDGTASIIVVQTGLQTDEHKQEAKATWSSILARFLEGLA